MNREELLSAVKNTVLRMDPNARLYLYGSRARGDAGPESDWDFLILLGEAPGWRRKQEIRHELYEIEWDAGEVLSSMFYGLNEWNEAPLRHLPLHQAIEEHGIAL